MTTILDAPSLASAVAVLAHPLRRGNLGADQAFARSLSRVPEDLWDSATKRSAWELLARHRVELERSGGDFAALPVPKAMANKPRPNGRSVNVEGGAWVFRFKYDAALIAALKAAIPGRRWNPDLRIWTAPLHSTPEVHTFATAHGFAVLSNPAERPEMVPEALRALPAKPRKTRPKVEPIRTKLITTRGDRWVIYPAPRSPAAVVGEIKSMPHAAYRVSEQCWTVPVAQCSEQVLAFADRWGYEVDAAAGSTAAAVVERTGRLLALSEAHKADDPLCAPFPIEGMTTLLTPDPWQWAGIRYMMEAKRTWNCDTCGLGKTSQAILATLANKAFPAVCVVPSSVKINWKREWEMWVPGIHVEVLYGTKGRSLRGLVPPDVFVVNYDIVGRFDRATGTATGWLPHLAALNPKTLICDESQFLKEKSTQRTAACEGLAASLDPDANIFLLTGTAVMSKAKEAASQLKIMRRMAELGGTRYFNMRYVKTTANLPELNHRLRARSFVRRTDELLGIRKARPSYVPLELDPVVMAEYAKAEANVVEYLRAWALNAALEAGATDEEARAAAWHKAMKASMAEHLVRVGVLKRLAGKAKLPAAIAYVEQILSEPDEKVIVFAENTELVDAIAARFGNTKIQGGQNAGERQSAVDRFNDDPRCRVIAAQLQAGNAGINLQKSCRHVMFLQQGWTPAIHLQAEGRAFRRGQTRTVIPTYLVAPDTIDQAITKLVADKRPIVDAVMDGKQITEEQAAALDRSIAEDLLVGMVDDALDG